MFQRKITDFERDALSSLELTLRCAPEDTGAIFAEKNGEGLGVRLETGRA